MNQPNRILIFDTETSGLIPKHTVPLDEQPYVLQLSYIVYDVETNRVIKVVDWIIRPPEHVVIQPIITEITGITREICDSQGVPIELALRAFNEDYERCDLIVAHNIEFDSEMIRIEVMRNSDLGTTWSSLIKTMFPLDNSKPTYCTMIHGRGICNIQRTQPSGRTWIKPPRLEELYERLFSKKPQNLHNALVDTYVCLRCFVKMRFDRDLTMDTSAMV
jgi:DNA polymerase III epsilon subunit-like protein